MRELTLDLARWLTSDAAQAALETLEAEAVRDQALLATLTTLRQRYTPAQAAALVDQARLRLQARDKFGTAAAQMLFVDEALQQASGRAIARTRAARYAPFAHVADLGSGIGGDALALSRVCASLLALELDPVRALFAAHNLRVAGGGATVRVEQADWTTVRFPATVAAAFADPARRVGGRRVFSLHEMVPPLSAILAVQRQIPALGVKVMPGVTDDEVPPDCEVEWISEGGTCKEGVLWFGPLRVGVARTATVLDAAGAAHTLTGADPAPPTPVTPPRAFLIEPEACVIRATLVLALAHHLAATQIDPQIAYLTSDHFAPTPLARGWPVLEHHPFNLKHLNRRLRALEAHVVAVKKRGSPIEPERFRRRLKSAPGGQPVTVFVTRHHDQPWMVLGGEEVRVP